MLKILNYKSFAVVLVAAVLWFGVSALDVAVQKGRIKKEVKDLSGKIERLERENQFLGRSGEYFRSDSFLERQARLKLNYKLPDEKVVFVYDVAASGQQWTFQDELRVMENYRKWWYYLLGY